MSSNWSQSYIILGVKALNHFLNSPMILCTNNLILTSSSSTSSKSMKSLNWSTCCSAVIPSCYSSKSHSYGLWCCTHGLGQPLLPDLVQKFKKQCFIPYTRHCPELHACTRGSVIPNPRVSIKTLKKYIISSFSGGDRGFTCWITG